MTLDEAIQRLGEEVEWALPSDDLKSLEAVRLAIEALKLLAEQPPNGFTCVPRPLPGETRK